MACLCCRKRKMKCDGLRPVCTQCLKSNRGADCQYYEKKHISRTQLLQQKVAKLEARLRELESEQSESASSSSSASASSSAPSPAAQPVNPGLLDYSDGLSLKDGSSHSGSIHGTFPVFDFTPQSSFALADPFPADTLWQSQSLLQTPSSPPSPSAHATSFSQRSSSLNWWEDGNVFCENKQRLLETFFAHRHQCAFDVHLGRFQSSLFLAPSYQPHPALMDAIYLLACYFSRSSHLTKLEPHFLKRALQGITDALQKQDRMVHVLQASSLLAVYFFCNGRVLEGYYHSSTSARLTIDLGLHQLKPVDWPAALHMPLSGAAVLAPQASGSGSSSASTQEATSSSSVQTDVTFPLPPPRDPIEHAERVAAFWQIFIVDRAWSVVTGLPSALPDDDHPRTQIETSWPMSIMDMSMSPEASGTLLPVYGERLPGPDLAASTATLRAKAVMLFERTARFSQPRHDSDWLEHRSLEMSLAQFSTNLPEITRRTPQIAVDIELVSVHTLIHTATIHLNRAHLEASLASFEKCLAAANAVATIISKLAESDYGHLDPINGTCWRSVADVYVRVLTAAQTYGLQCDAMAIGEALSMLVAAMRRLTMFFPVATMP
ncbi:uncharacterized protein LAESUDRAFT_729034 [Laetiporus sulphureus 93-53]|uniref:Zn(2)-C6 fungal-type domain-containing protein n=1 Tax=Laetiporus sulphureus 93-53 TaxID=1314785 RepID=A0A165CUQ7_9APHY|nr:uncharacterized protein LAESUDRAFT_729034 [Laetiporus sulphureus 93-53]KZT03463.1 hypothetical protein LAESUDRAFT_729034 [Laetiporus sulphureus 93-53]